MLNEEKSNRIKTKNDLLKNLEVDNYIFIQRLCDIKLFYSLKKECE